MTRFCAYVLISATVLFEVVIGQNQLTQYSTRYNNLNVDQILSSDRLVTNYVECLLSRKPCPPEGKDLKRILPEALRTKCARCSPQQLEGGMRVITKLYYDYPTQYSRLRAKWDPTGEYHRRFEEYLRGLQFNTINNDQLSPQPTAGTSTTTAQKIPTIVASASSNTQNVIPTALPSATALFNNTQRPARNPEIAQKPSTNSVAPPVGIFNRFAADDDDNTSGGDSTVSLPTTTTRRTMPTLAAVPSQRATQATTKRPAKRPNVVVNETPATVRVSKHPNKVVRTTNQPSTVEYTIYTYNTQPDVVYIQTQHPLIGLINSIGFKISNTADFFAGMLRGTIEKWFIV
ncbi:uncharacterized protein LOC116337733 isoform X2 [Contarinia nasturtii]|uniref:uncharacterized protein LOC116337733 isoform X2 n=1 Tax=Contarinia nasturtii TaxID=265458 RepID=UPI0012D44A80|nr:uncharacterized protein LOC116337733 isoform X2 [Contarinia nasturtii]